MVNGREESDWNEMGRSGGGGRWGAVRSWINTMVHNHVPAEGAGEGNAPHKHSAENSRSRPLHPPLPSPPLT